MVHPRRQRFIGEHELVADAELVRNPHDARLRCERVGALFPDEAILIVRFDVAANVVARLGEQHIHACAV